MTMLKPALFVCVGILLGCALMEGALRITDPINYDRFENDATSGLLHNKPNSTFMIAGACFSNLAHANNEGFYAAEFPTQKKDPREFRIELIGSSFAESQHTPLSETPAGYLENILNSDPDRRYDFKVIPIAFSGNGTYLDILYYLRYGQALEPDLIIDLTTDYEVTRNGPDAPFEPRFDVKGGLIIASSTSSVANTRVSWIKNILRGSKLVMNLYDRFLVLNSAAPQTQLGDVNPSVPDQKVLASAWDTEGKLLAQFSVLAKKSGARFALASWAPDDEATSSKQSLHEHLLGIATHNTFPYLDLIPALTADEQESGVPASLSCDDHWSSVGNRYAASALAEFLRSQRLLSKS